MIPGGAFRAVHQTVSSALSNAQGERQVREEITRFWCAYLIEVLEMYS